MSSQKLMIMGSAILLASTACNHETQADDATGKSNGFTETDDATGKGNGIVETDDATGKGNGNLGDEKGSDE